MKPFTLAAQISTAHSVQSGLAVDDVFRAVTAARAILPVPILIVGGCEYPALFNALTNGPQRPAGEVYLWYNLLSDYPGLQGDDLVVNFRGERGAGWEGWQQHGDTVRETFLFGCPNNPDVRRKTLAGLRGLLQRYPFDGVFLDKFRYPSPANGLEMALSCFCPHCCQRARQRGLDLERVRALLAGGAWRQSPPDAAPSCEHWLDALVAQEPLLRRFLRFRAESITALVKDVHVLLRASRRRLALDLFTPAIAPLVAQEYTALARFADWGKPMTYRLAYGPAGMRLEVEGLLTGVQRIYAPPQAQLLRWTQAHYPPFTAAGYEQMLAGAAPLSWLRHELEQAVRHFYPRPVLMGLETVSFPGVIDVTPAQVGEMVRLGLECGVDGAVISWDVLHTPPDNLAAIRTALSV